EQRLELAPACRRLGQYCFHEWKVHVHVLQHARETPVQRLWIDTQAGKTGQHRVAPGLAALQPPVPERSAQLLPTVLAHLGKVGVERNLERMLPENSRAERVDRAQKCTIDLTQRTLATQPRFTVGFRFRETPLQLVLKPLPQLVGRLPRECHRRNSL